MRTFRLTATFTLLAAVPIVVHLDSDPGFGLCLALPFALGVGFAGWVVDEIMNAGRRDARPPKTF
ncbi:MAG: hypothetical protein H6724_14695 [Sandaracinus sp.]|nr:hypothetical protein [Myxococcales bacterium]MCB9620684.1 hypothetical protein [Sandaracinus sp.]